MTAHRRGGRPIGSVGRRKRQPQRRRSTSTSDENSSEGDSVTRCVCGETHNLGLMVQCDKCEVWQHCRCMGLEQPDIPDQYYCEQCKPEHHKTTRLANGRNKRHYNALGYAVTTTTTTMNQSTTQSAAQNAKNAPKKRMTLNSREASMSLEDVLAARNALEMYESNTNEDNNSNDKSDSPTNSSLLKQEGPILSNAVVDQMDSTSLAIESEVTTTTPKSYKRKREMEIKLPETIDEKPEPPSSTVSSVGQDELPILKEQDESPEPMATTTPKVPKQNRRKAKEAVVPTNKRANTRGNGGKKRGKPRSRTSTPQPTTDSSPHHQQPSDEENTPNGDNISTMLFEYFSPQARASSPPAKTRHPHARMSISEMNRRANQILEYISSIQVEMATNPSSIQHAGHKVIKEKAVGDDDDDNDSLSSASTIPLQRSDNEDEEEEPADREKQSSMEIMDMLTRKLIKFQKRFGSRNRVLYEEAMMEGEGRITRSREASGTNNPYRNMMAH